MEPLEGVSPRRQESGLLLSHQVFVEVIGLRLFFFFSFFYLLFTNIIKAQVLTFMCIPL